MRDTFKLLIKIFAYIYIKLSKIFNHILMFFGVFLVKVSFFLQAFVYIINYPQYIFYFTIINIIMFITFYFSFFYCLFLFCQQLLYTLIYLWSSSSWIQHIYISNQNTYKNIHINFLYWFIIQRPKIIFHSIVINLFLAIQGKSFNFDKHYPLIYSIIINFIFNLYTVFIVYALYISFIVFKNYINICIMQKQSKQLMYEKIKKELLINTKYVEDIIIYKTDKTLINFKKKNE